MRKGTELAGVGIDTAYDPPPSSTPMKVWPVSRTMRTVAPGTGAVAAATEIDATATLPGRARSGLSAIRTKTDGGGASPPTAARTSRVYVRSSCPVTRGAPARQTATAGNVCQVGFVAASDPSSAFAAVENVRPPSKEAVAQMSQDPVRSSC